MNHPAELAVHQYLECAKSDGTNMSEDTIDKVCEDIRAAMRRQFAGQSGRGAFRPRMSNVGRPTCQLWYEKNKPDTALPRPTTFKMTMILGDIVEAVFKGLLTEAGVKYEENKKAGGWWVINKASGEFKYVPATGLDIKEECDNINTSLKKLKENVFERCFEPETEYFRSKPTGHKVLCKTCSFCDYRKDCWPSLQQKPMLMSRAVSPKMVDYVYIQGGEV